jgi:hypothetical protein
LSSCACVKGTLDRSAREGVDHESLADAARLEVFDLLPSKDDALRLALRVVDGGGRPTYLVPTRERGNEKKKASYSLLNQAAIVKQKTRIKLRIRDRGCCWW